MQPNKTYLDVPAVCREVHLYDKACNVFAVAYSVQGRTLSEIIEIHSMFL